VLAGFTFTEGPTTPPNIFACCDLTVSDNEKDVGVRDRSLAEEKENEDVGTAVGALGDLASESRSASSFSWSVSKSKSREHWSVLFVRTASSFACRVATSRHSETA